ncbi:hypothetical protein PVK06_021018 [Gossypium arboreum]|uniref:RBR-type E3 ubiquitin transferase n=1 Tax=Gossypium arboreum TaxID=29729 RepID=A0ABR0PP42_GOSAR|nr:hypothetical protein PVK06_021018 [Gossypium arboreum]
MEETDESVVGVEEDEEDFRSYCEDEDVWKETEGVIMYKKKLDNPLLLALRERILELAHNLEEFVLKLTPSINLLRPLQLAQVAIGVISSPAKGDKSLENCSICCEDKPTLMMINIKCSHKFCSHCMRTYVYAGASSSTQSDNSCVECPVCRRFICVECGVPWRSSTSCEEYQNLPLEERDAADITLHLLAQNKRCKPFQRCTRMIELTQGCYHMTCRCGHEFCYSCGAEYREGQQTCLCALWDEDNSEDLVTHCVQESEQWAWETFNSLPTIMDANSDQERSHRALIQRFLAGGFSPTDHHHSPLYTDSYVDTMKDLHQLPWLQ